MTKEFIELYVDFENKDKVKSLGCKWNSELYTWVFPLSNSMNNLEALILLQDNILLYFVEKRLAHDKVKIYKNEDVIKIKKEYDVKNILTAVDDANPLIKTIRKHYKDINDPFED
jgi:hypothetical protein